MNPNVKKNLKRPLQVNKRVISNSHESTNENYWIDKICNEKSSPEEQIPLIVEQIEAQSEYYSIIFNITEDLYQIINFFYGKQICVKPFGSGMTKLALRNSDIDVFLDFEGNLPEHPDYFARSLRNKLKKRGRIFKRPIAIPARVPIVRCIHYSGVNCDISFLNGLGVSNSKLVSFILSLDERIRPFILILKYLFKKEKIIGSNTLTSYALTILIIYFLQQLKDPLVPAINYLQERATEKETVAGWDTSYVSDKNLLPPIHNNSSITDLFKQFFGFFATFEFGFYVLSTYTVKTYLKPFFANPESIAQEFPNYMKNLKENKFIKFECNKPMCVQGPFNHSHNITRNVRLIVLQKFQSLCSDFYEICQNSAQQNEKNSEFFKKLFKLGDEDSKNKKFKKESIARIYVGKKLTFTDCNCTEVDLRRKWSKTTLLQINDALTKVLRCKVTTESFEKNQNEVSDFSNGEVLQLLKCEFYHMELITKKRNLVKPEFEFTSNMTIIEQEEIISDYLCDTVVQNSDKVLVQFKITCSIEKGPTCLCLKLDSDEGMKGNKGNLLQLFNFIQMMFPKWIQ